MISLGMCEPTGDDGAILSFGYGSPYDPRAIFRLAASAKRNFASADIVHAHLFPTSLYVALLNFAGVLPQQCIFTEHSTNNRRRDFWWARLLDRWIYSRFTRVVAISDGVRDALLDAHPQLKGKVSIVRNGIKLHSEMPERDIGNGRVRLVSAGRLKNVKNYPVALKAVSSLTEHDIEYSILGGGPMRPELEAMIEELGLGENVKLAGHVGDVRAHLEAADIFLMPSKWEGFGLAAVEAMNAGLPLVVSDVPGLREVVGEDGECAFLVDPEQPGQIAGALYRLIENPKLRAAMGRRAFERSLEFGQDAMVDGYIDVYRSVVGTQHG
jgi:glycosyltransferase involved in cell wall biosynthesis